MGFKDVQKNSRRGGPVAQPLLVQFVSHNLVDPKRSSAADSFVATLVRPALGKAAGEQVEIVLGEFKKSEGGKDRPSIWDHANGKNRVAAAKEGTYYLFEGCVSGAGGKIEARWIRNLGQPDPEQKAILLSSIMAKVMAPNADKDGSYSVKRPPTVHLMDVTRAVRVGGHALKEGEVALTAEQLADPEKIPAGQPRYAHIDDAIKAALSQQFAGDPGVMLRIIPDDNTDRPFSASFIRPSEKKGEEWVALTPEQALEVFKERHGGYYNAVLSEKDGFAEIIPFVSIRAGTMTAEKAIKDVTEAKAKDPNDRFPKDRVSKQFYGDVVVESDKGDRTQFRSCFMDAVVGLRSMDPSSGFYFWTDAIPMDRRKFADAEVITDNLSDDLAAKYAAAATERGKFKGNDAKADAAPEKGNEENFGEDPQVEGAASPAPGR